MLKFINSLLLIFVFLLPWQARWVIRALELNGGFWEYGTISLYATDVIFFVILFLVGIRMIQHNPLSPPREPPPSPPWKGGARGGLIMGVLCTGYLFLSIFWSFDKLIAFYAALKLVEGIALFLIVRKFQSYEVGPHKIGGPTSILSWAFVASAVVQSMLAIAQFFTQSVFAWPFSGIAPQNLSDLGVSVVQFGDERWLRAYGSFPHPNLLGAFLAIALFFLFHLTLTLSSKERGVKNYPLLLGEGWVRLRWLLLSTYCLLLTGLFFTFSRAAWIAFFIGLFVYALHTKAWREKIFLQLTLLFIVVATILTALFFPLVRTRIGGASRLEMKSNQERTTGYREAVQLIKAHPFFGVGIGNSTTAVARELRPSDPAWSYQPAHNVFLLILSELGIIGFLFLTGFFWSIKKIFILHSSFIILLLVLSLFDHSFWTLHSGILLLWGALALDRGQITEDGPRR